MQTSANKKAGNPCQNKIAPVPPWCYFFKGFKGHYIFPKSNQKNFSLIDPSKILSPSHFIPRREGNPPCREIINALLQHYHLLGGRERTSLSAIEVDT